MIRFVCNDCRNEFNQPFVCITCGAQKLYDTTLKSAETRADRAELRAEKLARKLAAALSANRGKK